MAKRAPVRRPRKAKPGTKGLEPAQCKLETSDGSAMEAAEAVEKAKDLNPDVMVLDVTMPRMNGLEACRLLRRQSPKLEILFVTQHDSPQMMREALEAGARGYVVKSNAARDLLAAVEAVSQHRVFTALHGRSLPELS